MATLNTTGSGTMRSRGFTLMEMLVVIAVIGILAALLLPTLSSAKARARRTTCLNNLKQINLGVHLYADDHNDVLTLVSTNTSPSVWTDYKNWIKGYVGLTGPSSPQDALFACPADIYNYEGDYFEYKPVGLHTQLRYDYSSYAFNAGNIRDVANRYPGIAGRKLTSIKNPTKTVLVTEWTALDPYSWHENQRVPPDQDGMSGSRNVVSFVDSHVSYIKIYWDSNTAPTHIQAWQYDPPADYDYKWSGD